MKRLAYYLAAGAVRRGGRLQRQHACRQRQAQHTGAQHELPGSQPAAWTSAFGTAVPIAAPAGAIDMSNLG
jgi:hypothetical protein